MSARSIRAPIAIPLFHVLYPVPFPTLFHVLYSCRITCCITCCFTGCIRCRSMWCSYRAVYVLNEVSCRHCCTAYHVAVSLYHVLHRVLYHKLHHLPKNIHLNILYTVHYINDILARHFTRSSEILYCICNVIFYQVVAKISFSLISVKGQQLHEISLNVYKNCFYNCRPLL